MKRIITIANQKGGVGKTTSVINIAAGIANQGNRVLILDLDSQMNTTLIYQQYITNENSILDIYEDEEATLENAIQKVADNENLFFIPGHKKLAFTENAFDNGDEWILKEKLDDLEEKFDYILIDTPPLLGFITTSALLASTDVIIPVQADMFSFQGITNFQKSLMKIKKRNNPDLNILGIILTKLKKSNSGKQMATTYEEMCVQNECKLLGIIPDNVDVNDAFFNLTDVFTYNSRCNGAKAYMEVIENIIGGKE